MRWLYVCLVLADAWLRAAAGGYMGGEMKGEPRPEQVCAVGRGGRGAGQGEREAAQARERPEQGQVLQVRVQP